VEELVKEVARSIAIGAKAGAVFIKTGSGLTHLQLAHPQNTGLAVYQEHAASVDSYRRTFARFQKVYGSEEQTEGKSL
jgi:hypothetical protein